MTPLIAEAIEPTVRWTLAAPDPERIPRPNADARIAMLRTALDATLAGMRRSDQEHLVRLALLLTSPIAYSTGGTTSTSAPMPRPTPPAGLSNT